MRRIILTYGLIAGVIVDLMIVGSMPLYDRGILNFDNGTIVGFATIIIALSMVFFGIKSCRDFHFKGSITFWQGVKVGLLITLIASVMYALVWEISYYNSDFGDKMWQHYAEEATAGAGTEEERRVAAEDVEEAKELYANPLLFFPLALMEILPVGIVITFISAAILRRKDVLPA